MEKLERFSEKLKIKLASAITNMRNATKRRKYYLNSAISLKKTLDNILKPVIVRGYVYQPTDAEIEQYLKELFPSPTFVKVSDTEYDIKNMSKDTFDAFYALDNGLALIPSPTDPNIFKINHNIIKEDRKLTQQDLNVIGNRINTDFSIAIVTQETSTLSYDSPTKKGLTSNLYTPKSLIQFYYLLQTQYPVVNPMEYIQLYPATTLPAPFKLFTAIESNCVMDIIEEYIKTPNYVKNMKKYDFKKFIRL